MNERLKIQKPPEVPPGFESVSTEGLPVRVLRLFDVGDPWNPRRPPCYVFRVDVQIEGFDMPFIAGWHQDADKPEPDKSLMLATIMGLGAYTARRIAQRGGK